MADQNPQHGRRPHFHRGRRGPDRRGNDRRNTPPQDQQGARDHVDVEQIMREIRARISQRHGIDLTTQQIQELAARRLEAILDPRTVKPSLLEQLRRSAGSPIEPRPVEPELSYAFEATTLYESPNAFVRFMRRLLQPLLKLFFNPNPLIQAMHTQTRINQAARARDAERERRQAEWNALHYEILQRLVLEISRTSLEGQGLSMRVESLAAKVDFNERRVRGVENAIHQARPPQRHAEPAAAQIPAPPQPSREAAGSEVTPAEGPREGAPREGGVEGGGGRRRRRRRRGRRPPMGTPVEGGATPQAGSDQPASGTSAIGDVDTEPDIDEDDEEESTSIEAATPVERPADESPVTSPQPAAPAYGFDPFAPASAAPPAPAPPGAASAPEPSTATASDAKPASEDVHSTEPRDPSDSNT
jgi:hypothetical protein